VASDVPIEIVPGVIFNAWAFNGQVPGPTLRAREGDKLRIHFVNAGSHSHTMHFHGIHADIMDGIPNVGPGEIRPGGRFTYEFDADPHGVHLYHCHATPLKRHIHKGLYGAYIVDPADGWGDPAHEMVMMLNGFDTNFDGENEVYSVNTKAFAYVDRPIRIKRDELQRVFLVNITEFDPLNSLHLHGNFFHYTEIGHKSNPRRFTDNVALIQGERGMLEFHYKMPGKFMFHAHQSELAELGWVGMFEVE
jgi:manganese oxidase